MNTENQNNHDANNTGGGNNAGADLSGLGTTADDLGIVSKGNNNSNSQDSNSSNQNSQQNSNTNNTGTTNSTDKDKNNQNASSDSGNNNSTDGNDTNQEDKPKAVEIDGVSFEIDKDGNAVDKDKKIVKTKAEIDALIIANEEIPLVEEVLQKSGYKILGDNGKPKVYEDSTEGLLALATDIANEKAKVVTRKFFDKFPRVEDFAKHLERGGTETEYFAKQSSAWSNVKFDDKNEDQLTGAVVAELTGQGISKEQAELTAKMYKDTDKLKQYGKEAYGRLVGKEKADDAKKEADFNTQLALDKDAEDKHWNNVNQVIKKGTLHNIIIPETDRDEFFSYIAFAADENGNSKAAIDRDKLPLEQQLQLDYLLFKGFDLKKLISSAVKQEKVLSLRSRMAQNQKGASGGEGVNKGNYAKPNDVDVSIDNLQM